MTLPVNRCNLLCFSSPGGYFARLRALPISKATRFSHNKMQEKLKDRNFYSKLANISIVPTLKLQEVYETLCMRAGKIQKAIISFVMSVCLSVSPSV
jgi:hypothetical protein